MIQKETFFLKNMTTRCCIKVLQLELGKAGLHINDIQLGQVTVEYNPDHWNTVALTELFTRLGFPVIKNRELVLVEQIKTAVIELIHQAGNINSIIRNSDYLVEKLGYSYPYLSGIFSKHEKTTLEKYIILQKIEKVKELIDYGELTLSEIAYQMGYSSVNYLSSQFKSITGYSVTDYKHLEYKNRNPVDEL